MSPYFLDKFWDLVVNLVSIILGGGAIATYIEWRRYQRERRAEKREEEKVAVDVINGQIAVKRWELDDKMKSETKLRIYENQLQGTVKHYTILAEFVLRNTTNAELVLAQLETEEPGVQKYDFRPGDVYEVYDMQTGDLIGGYFPGVATLSPLGTLQRAVWIERNFHEKRKLETPPSTLTVGVTTSEGKEITRNIPLRDVPMVSPATFDPEDDTMWYGRAKEKPPRLRRPEEEFPEEEIPF